MTFWSPAHSKPSSCCLVFFRIAQPTFVWCRHKNWVSKYYNIIKDNFQKITKWRAFQRLLFPVCFWGNKADFPSDPVLPASFPGCCQLLDGAILLLASRVCCHHFPYGVFQPARKGRFLTLLLHLRSSATGCYRNHSTSPGGLALAACLLPWSMTCPSGLRNLCGT